MTPRIYYCLDHGAETDGTGTEHQLCSLKQCWAEWAKWEANKVRHDFDPMYLVKGHHFLAGTVLDANTLIRLGFTDLPDPKEPCPQIQTNGTFY